MSVMEEFFPYREFMTINVCSRKIREKKKILLYGKCVRDEYQEIFHSYSEGRIPLAVCMEREHINMVGFKLAGLLARVDVEEIVVLTVDGSPHCVQLHFALEEVEKILGRKIERKHYVIEDGRVVRVSNIAVKKARYISWINKILKEKDLGGSR